MGGSGSTRWADTHTRPLADAALPWPVDTLRPSLPTSDGRAIVTREWSRGGASRASAAAILVREGDKVTATLAYTRAGQPVADTLDLVRGTSNLPGNRPGPWRWVCACGRLASILYHTAYTGGRWRCRRCSRVTYRSSNESDKRVSAILRSGLDQVVPDLCPDFKGMGAARMGREMGRHLTQMLLLIKAYDRDIARRERTMRRWDREDRESARAARRRA